MHPNLPPEKPSMGDMLKTSDAMRRLNYVDRGSFWALVYKKGIPHVRYNARNIQFPRAGLEDWIRRHSSDAS